MIKIVIFDIDGTLLDSIKYLQACTNHTLKQYGFPEHSVDAYKYFVGDGMRKLVERALPEDKRKDEFIQVFLQDFLAYYSVHKEDFTQPYEGVTELLMQLQRNNFQIAVATNKVENAAIELIHKYFPEIKFSTIVGQREGIPVKPHPQVIEDILAQTHTDLSEAIMVGDTSVDIKTAKNANIKSSGVLWGFRTQEELQQAEADYIIEKPEEIIAIVEKN